MTIYTVGDLIKELQKYSPDEPIGLYVNGIRMRYFHVTDAVVQDNYYGPTPISIYGREKDEPLYTMIYLGDPAENVNNIRIYKARGTYVSPDDVRNMVQLDPKPYVYTDPVTNKTSRLTSDEAEPWDEVVDFTPRTGYSQDKNDYMEKT